MSVSRRDFMKLVGVSISSLLLNRCSRVISFATATPEILCYAPTAIPLTARERLHGYWLSFGELAQETIQESTNGVTTQKPYNEQLTIGHRAALDELAASGELTPAVADLVQEAYAAAVYHVWRSNNSMTCYTPARINFAPISADILVKQADVLQKIANQGNIDPQTLDAARAAIEHDMAFYTLTDAEVNGLYTQLVADWQAQGKSLPAFGAVDLEITPDAKAATQFIIDLLINK